MLFDDATLARFREFLGRDPHPTGAGLDIFHIKAPKWPAYRFEWHPKERKLYLIRLAVEPPMGEAIGVNIETHGDAYNAVQIFLRGVREGQAARAGPLGLKL